MRRLLSGGRLRLKSKSSPPHRSGDGKAIGDQALPGSMMGGRQALPGAPQRVAQALDVYSAQFDPLQALRAGSIPLPEPSARPLDNLYRCRQLLPREHPDALQPVQRGPASKEAELARERAKSRVGYVQQQRERQQQRQNPLEEMMARVGEEGPLALLRRAYLGAAPVRVVTRHGRGVRGVATGTLVAYDKYCNLVLRDVDESYTVLLRALRGARALRGQERRQRHLKQVFVRGEGVVMVSLAAPAAPGAGAAPRVGGGSSRAPRADRQPRAPP